MKKVLVIAALLLMVSAFAMASATNWMLYLQSMNLDGSGFGVDSQLGVKPLATDDWDSLYDGIPQDRSTGSTDAKWVGCPLAGEVYSKNFMSTAAFTSYPGSKKIWDLRVAGMSASAGPIKFQFKTGTATATKVAPATSTMRYAVKLVNARNQVVYRPTWAPNAGAVWNAGDEIVLTIPTTTSTVFGAIELPLVKSSNDNVAFEQQGYDIQFIQEAVPEPGSLLVLGTGLLGLVGFVARRRK